MIRKFLFTLVLFLFTGISAFAQSTPGTVRYPANLDDLDSLFRVGYNSSTTLTLTVNASATSITVGSTASFPTTGSLVMGSEVCYYTAKTSNTFSGLLRGRDGTTAAGHPAGILVRGPIIPPHHIKQNEAIIAVQTKLGYGGSNAADAPTGACSKKNGDGTTTWVLCVQSSDLVGLDGSGLSGFGGTGGLINPGTTTIGADSDSDGVGVVSLQTKGVERVAIDPDGILKGTGVVKAVGGENLYAHGAKGDGNHATGAGANDSAAFLSAINAAVAPGGSRKVIVPAGVFKVGSTVTKAFSSTHDLVIQGSGSGSIILLATGAGADGFSLTSAYSITFRDVIFAGNAAGSFTPDARVGINLGSVIKATFDGCAFYGIYALNGLIFATNVDLLVQDSKFRGSATNGGAGYIGLIRNYGWIGVTVRDCHFLDYGDLHGVYHSKTPVATTTAWVTAEKPSGDLIQTIIGTAPPTGGAGNAYSQGVVHVENCKMDEGALYSVLVVSNPTTEPWTARVYIRGNNTNAAFIGGGYYFQTVRRLDFVQNWVGYTYNNEVVGIHARDVEDAYIRDSFFEQRAGLIRIEAFNLSPVRAQIENNHYQTLQIMGAPTSVEILQEGKRIRRLLSPATYNYAQMTAVVSNVESLPGADVASASSIVPTGNFFNLTGTTTTSTITVDGVELGSTIRMVAPGVLTFDEAGNIDISGGTSLTTTANQIVEATWDGTKWRLR